MDEKPETKPMGQVIRSTRPGSGIIWARWFAERSRKR